jgi:pSer/pThr/pTyr-binding forkhead associated (FHA) protein
MLAPPESRLVIGRGDDAGWIIDDEELSRAHVEVRRGWDGAWLRDLGSKNGTKLEGVRVCEDPVELRDGAGIQLGNMRVRFHDPADRHLRARPATAATTQMQESVPARAFFGSPSMPVFYVAMAIAIAAAACAIWVVIT